MYRWFETRIEAYPEQTPERPPTTLGAFYIYFIRPVWPVFIVLLVVGFIGSVIEVSLMAFIGSTPGNRFVAIVPNAKAIGMDPGARDGLGQHGVSFQADGADSSFYLAQF